MKPWLQLTVITITVGGGFAGATGTLQSLSTASTFNLAVSVLFMGLYTFVCVSGLMYVHNPKWTGPLVVALALQIPSISSSLIVYKFISGVSAFVVLGSPQKENTFGVYGGGELFLGSTWRFGLSNEHPLRVGINVAVLAILALVLRTTRSASDITQTIGHQESAASYSPTQAP